MHCNTSKCMQQEFEQKPPRDILKMPRNNSFYFRAKFGVTYSAFKYLLKNSTIGNRLVRSGGLKKVMASILTSDSCKCWGKKTARNSGIFSLSFTACLQPAVADFVPVLDQISLRNNFFHSGI